MHTEIDEKFEAFIWDDKFDTDVDVVDV